jgi:Xaa-Pro dipeptidase
VDERLLRTAAAVKAAGANWAVLTSAGPICYALGHVVPIEAGASPFAGGATTAFVGADASCGIVVANVEASAAKASRADATIIYEGFAFDRDADLVGNYSSAIRAMQARLGVGGVLAIEPVSFTAQLGTLLNGEQTADIRPTLRRARATKTTEEVKAMRRAAQAAAIGQATFYKASRAGRTELDVFAEIRSSIENFAGERTPITGDFLSGRTRTAAFTGWPNDRVIQRGDPLISDLAPRVGGYWGDSCASAVLGEADAGYLKLFRAARGALDRGLELMRPGLRIAELDAELRRIVSAAGYSYPHHSGHSLGTEVHEWPRIVPYEHAALEAGMFLMIEPGAYDPAVGGVRTEWMIEITADGCRPVAPFAHRPSIASDDGGV